MKPFDFVHKRSSKKYSRKNLRDTICSHSASAQNRREIKANSATPPNSPFQGVQPCISKFNETSMPIDIAKIAPGAVLGGDGIWYSASAEKVSYPEDGHATLVSIEDDSFWFRHRNQCITDVVRMHPPPANGEIYDIGGGNGYVALGLVAQGFESVLVEPGATGAKNAKQRGLKHVVCATTDSAKFLPASLPAIGLFDVIEHIEDDQTFLRSMRALLPEGGMLYATVPAYSALWSEEDIEAGHFRRHTIKSISDLLESAEFELVFSSYIFRFLPLPILLLRTLPYRLGIKRQRASSQLVARDHSIDNSLGSKILGWLLKSERKIIKHQKKMRFGGSILLVARARVT